MIPQFAMRLICGLASVWCLAPRRQITSGFFRIQMLLTLGLGVLAAVTANQWSIAQTASAETLRVGEFALAIGVAVCAFLGSVLWTLERRRSGLVMAVLILVLAGAACLWPAALGTSAIETFLRSSASALSSAWILGATTAAMLLGHWYLTATGMPLQPLVNYTWLCGLTVLLRLGTAVLDQWWPMAGETDGGNWTLQALRWGGLLAPLLMVVLTLRILRYRNTQSATGVLYAGTILVFMGEMAAALLGCQG